MDTLGDRPDDGPAVTTEVIGRDADIAVIRAFLDRPPDGPRALVLEGFAGIGKTTLWSAGVDLARQRFPGRVLASRPSETEESLANVVLGDLFGGLPPEVMAALVPPRRAALEAALLLRGQDAPVDRRAVAAAVLNSLLTLAEAGPVVVAIDDDQWVDASSRACLGFALRRIAGAPVMVLLARRTSTVGPAGAAPDSFQELEEALDSARVERLRVESMSVGAIQKLLHARGSVHLTRPTLVRLHEAAGGNPLYCLELARDDSLQQLADPTAALPVPPKLERLLATRMDALPGATRDALLLVAAHGRLPERLVERLGIGDALDSARAAGILERDGAAMRFTHPLLASVIYQATAPPGRRAAHRRLAELVDDPVHGARHLALGTRGADPAVASRLEDAARLARRRGAPTLAGTLAEHAARLTIDDDRQSIEQRLVIAASAHLEAGEWPRARALAESVVAAAADRDSVAGAFLVLAELESPVVATEMLERALVELEPDSGLAAELHARLARTARFSRGRDWAGMHAREAVRIAEARDDDRLRALARSVEAVHRFERLEPGAVDLALDAQRLAVAARDPDVLRLTRWAVANLLAWTRNLAEARDWLERALADVGAFDELSRTDMLWYLALVEVWEGRWEEADAHSREAMAIASQYGVQAPVDGFASGLTALFRGRFGVAREWADRALALAEEWMLRGPIEILAIADLWEGNAAAALEKFEDGDRLARDRESADPSQRIGLAERAEALLQLGRTDEAEGGVAAWEAVAVRLGRAWIVAEAIRTRGLIAAARADLDGAAALLAEAVTAHAGAGDRFGRARALLALGGVRLRQRQKRLARDAIEAAALAFDELGAESWAAAARLELGRVGGHRRLEGLSPSELRVASLVAEGRTNREIATELFLGERTVASHLTSVYSKLKIRSRTELVARLPAHLASDGRGKIPTS